MAELALCNGGVALIDDDDMDLVRHVEWKRLTVANEYHYATTRGKRPVLLHRWLMLPPVGMVVDHINGDTLDNRRANLRVCTQAQNMMNRRRSVHSTSPYKGVRYIAKKRKWVATIGSHRLGGVRRSQLGYFQTAEEAAAAYDIAAVLTYGEFACLNFPHVFPEVPCRRA